MIAVSASKLSTADLDNLMRALPNHVLTWQYCGLWQIEQGNRDQAQENAERPGIAGPFFYALHGWT
jgi:hypothetical protein